MATPTVKHSKAATRSRRANHDKMTLQNTLICDNCGADRRPHRACPTCGHYKNRIAIAVKAQELAGAEAESSTP